LRNWKPIAEFCTLCHFVQSPLFAKQKRTIDAAPYKLQTTSNTSSTSTNAASVDALDNEACGNNGAFEMRIEIARNQIDRQLINDDNATHQSTEHTGECGRRRDVAQSPRRSECAAERHKDSPNTTHRSRKKMLPSSVAFREQRCCCTIGRRSAQQDGAHSHELFHTRTIGVAVANTSDKHNCTQHWFCFAASGRLDAFVNDETKHEVNFSCALKQQQQSFKNLLLWACQG
jgi:hypothetical protein